MDVGNLIEQFPELSWTAPTGIVVTFVPFGDLSDGRVTHSYAVPYVGPDECLITRRADGEWTIPGGTLEPSETWQEGLHRELLEETGSRIDAFQPIGAYCCAGEDITFRVVSWADVTQVEEPMDPDAGLPTSIVEVRRASIAAAAGLFCGRNHHYGAIYHLSTLIRASSR